jgi:hypothetical protein
LLPMFLIALWLGIAGIALMSGLDFYLLPMNDRAFSELAHLYAPTGLVGHGLGIVGTAMMVVGVAGYSARKRLAALAKAGALKHWLQVHIFLCTLGPFLVLLHTTFKFGGLVSIAFWSMVAVVVSGIFGRYVYVRIPKTVNGRFLSTEVVADRVRGLTQQISEGTGLEVEEMERFLGTGGALPRTSGLVSALTFALREDFRLRKELRGLRSFMHDRQVPDALRGPVLTLVDEQRRLRRQGLLLHPFQRLFRYWHVVHLPLATVMFLILGVHVTVSILFGYTWIF